MTTDRREVYEVAREFLERDGGEEALEAVLEVDSKLETWTFEDISVDSGTFGELVSRGIVEKTDNDYQVAYAEGVRAAISGDDLTAEIGREEGLLDGLSLEMGIWRDRQALVGLAAALVLVVIMRLTQYRAVFSDNRVISPGNDPYFYRYYMGELLGESTNPTDLRIFMEMPSEATSLRPLTHAFNWWFATLLGGDKWAADMITAWLPVTATVALAIVVYTLAMVITRDARIGIASVVMLAVAPVHVVYTQVGFLEHRLYQYFWLGVTLLTLGWLAVDLTRRRNDRECSNDVRRHLMSPITWIVTIVLGVSFGVSVHLWGGSPLLFVPLAGYIGLRAVIDAREGISPTLANLPILVGLVVGGVISIFMHIHWGWHENFVAYTPAMVLGGAIGVFLLGDFGRILQINIRRLVGFEGLVAVISIYTFRQFWPEDWMAAQTRIGRLFFREGATEASSLFSSEYAVIFGPLTQIGVSFYLGIAVLSWAIWLVYWRYEPAWLLLAVYASVFILLAAIQVRFAAQLMIPLSVFSGFGFVYLLSAIDLARRPLPLQRSDDRPNSVAVGDGSIGPTIMIPDTQKAVYVLGIGLLVCSFSLLYVPGFSAQISHGDAKSEAVLAIEKHAADTDRVYPETYVLSEWGDNRMYNYFVNGQSDSYSYARTYFDDFRFGNDPDKHYYQFEARTGYVVVTQVDNDLPANTTQVQLLEGLGTGGETSRPLEHYRLLFVDDDQTIAAFAMVPGATIEGTGETNGTINVSTNVSVDEESFTYVRKVQVEEGGQFEVTVPYSGQYSVGNNTVNISKKHVEDGSTIRVNDLGDDSNESG
ncbi:MFS transporter [Saliphagus sp. GCM10025334]